MAINKDITRALRILRLNVETFRQLAAIIYNDLRNYLADGVLQHGTLLIDAAAEKFKTTTIVVGIFDGVIVAKAATTALVFSGTSTINNAQAAGTGHWGVFTVQMASDKTISTKHGTYTSGTDQDYATEALAIAAKVAADAGKIEIGYITVQVKTGGNKWTEATDDLTPTSDCTTANFYNTTAKTLPDEYPEE